LVSIPATVSIQSKDFGDGPRNVVDFNQLKTLKLRKYRLKLRFLGPKTGILEIWDPEHELIHQKDREEWIELLELIMHNI